MILVNIANCFVKIIFQVLLLLALFAIVLSSSNADEQAACNASQAKRPFNILSGMKNSIGFNGKFDYQRNEGRGNISPELNLFYPAYTDSSNYAVGVYMRGAGYTLLATVLIALGYALYKGEGVRAFSPQMWQWWANG